MKVTVEFDCTPDEARQFMGLPDVKPLQTALMAKMEKQMLEAADGFQPDALLKTWFSMLPKGQEQLQDMFGRMIRTAFAGSKKPGDT